MPFRKPQYFDYLTVARDAAIRNEDLARLEAGVRADYPDDDMLYELRLLRVCNAIKDGAATVEDALREFPSGDRKVA